jgi:hypothetical protein
LAKNGSKNKEMPTVLAARKNEITAQPHMPLLRYHHQPKKKHGQEKPSHTSCVAPLIGW